MGEDPESLVCVRSCQAVSWSSCVKYPSPPPPKTKCELPCRVVLLSLLGPCVHAAWVVCLPAWQLKAREFLPPLGVLPALEWLGPVG